MCDGLNPTKTFSRARIQRTPNGRLLGVAIFLEAEIIEKYVTDSAEHIEYTPTLLPAGIMLEIGVSR